MTEGVRAGTITTVLLCFVAGCSQQLRNMLNLDTEDLQCELNSRQQQVHE